MGWKIMRHRASNTTQQTYRSEQEDRIQQRWYRVNATLYLTAHTRTAVNNMPNDGRHVDKRRVNIHKIIKLWYEQWFFFGWFGSVREISQNVIRTRNKRKNSSGPDWSTSAYVCRVEQAGKSTETLSTPHSSALLKSPWHANEIRRTAHSARVSTLLTAPARSFPDRKNEKKNIKRTRDVMKRDRDRLLLSGFTHENRAYKLVLFTQKVGEKSDFLFHSRKNLSIKFNLWALCKLKGVLFSFFLLMFFFLVTFQWISK